MFKFLKNTFIWILTAWVIPSGSLISKDIATKKIETGIILTGSARYSGKGKISILVQNISADKSDVFIASGSVALAGSLRSEGDAKLDLMINPEIVAGGSFVRLAASSTKDVLLEGSQMLRLEFLIPKEISEVEFKLVSLRVSFFKLPVAANVAALNKSTINIQLIDK
jgi:precorrin-4 methylase